MSLANGSRLGPYEIRTMIGAGGMGEVYRAHDAKLKRDVALKVLPEAFARDPERLARFEREAEVLASLNHPNIAAIYGVVEDRALVMELVEGSEPNGPLPFDEAWAIESQVAAALEYAHERGVVHRDLKPANIKVTPDGQMKLLDFGLAKAFSNQPDAPASPENSPTLTMGATQFGVILGTAAYIDPEQAKGKQVDKRADIWAFGVLLYELLTGERLFKGEDVSETLAQVLTKEPDLNKVPAKARKLLGRCLEKDPKKRLRDIGDAAALLEDDALQANAPARRSKLAWAVAAVFFIAFAIAGFGLWRETRPVDHPLMRLSIDLGPDALSGTHVTAAISPDGTRIVFPIRGQGGKQLLATRLLDKRAAISLTGTEGGFDPFFSPDGQWIGFFADGKLKKISVEGGAPSTLCDASDPRGASWREDGSIIVAPLPTAGLFRIPAAGGSPQPLTRLATGEITHRWPQVLPGGDAIVFVTSAVTGVYDNATIEAFSLKTGERKTLWRGGYFPRYLPTNASTGYLTYIREGTLFALPFDPARLEVRGKPLPLVDDVAGNTISGGGQYDFSRNGTLVYLSGQGKQAAYPIVWLDRTGQVQPLASKPATYSAPRFSPDGQHLAVAVTSSEGINVWVYDLSRDSMTRLTFVPGNNRYPVWTPDGNHIVFRSDQSTTTAIYWIRSDGAGEVRKLVESKLAVTPTSFSPDGRRLAYFQAKSLNGSDLWTLALDLSDPDHPKPGKPESLLSTAFGETLPEFSPDGQWMAYVSNESSRNEVYVRPFPGPGGKWQISTGGGTYPIWSRNGRELFYETIPPDHRIMVAEYIAKGDSFITGKPRLWSDKQILYVDYPNLDLAPDGKRFAVFPQPETALESKGNVNVTFLVNFFDELRRRVPLTK